MDDSAYITSFEYHVEAGQVHSKTQTFHSGFVSPGKVVIFDHEDL